MFTHSWWCEQVTLTVPCERSGLQPSDRHYRKSFEIPCPAPSLHVSTPGMRLPKVHYSLPTARNYVNPHYYQYEKSDHNNSITAYLLKKNVCQACLLWSLLLSLNDSPTCGHTLPKLSHSSVLTTKEGHLLHWVCLTDTSASKTSGSNFTIAVLMNTMQNF